MSDKLRSVNTRFWEDPFIEGLSPIEKLLFLYLLTNPLANLIGIYEITIKRISYDTSIQKESIEKALKSFEKVNKVLRIGNYVIMPNFLKNQSLNENMKIGVVKLFKSLPNYLKEKLLGKDYLTIQNDYISLLNGLLKLNGIEREIESESEKPNKSADFIDQIIALFVCIHGEYEIINRGKERAAASKILQIYKKKCPDANSQQILEGMRKYFEICVDIPDTWMQQNMSLPLIASKFNEINNILKNGTKRNSKAPDGSGVGDVVIGLGEYLKIPTGR